MHALSLATVVGLLVIVGIVLGTGIASYPAMAADEGNYLEQAWAINHDALSHVTSWCDGRRLGWIELWLMATGPRARHEKLVTYALSWLPSASARGPSGGPASGGLTA